MCQQKLVLDVANRTDPLAKDGVRRRPFCWSMPMSVEEMRTGLEALDSCQLLRRAGYLLLHHNLLMQCYLQEAFRVAPLM